LSFQRVKSQIFQTWGITRGMPEPSSFRVKIPPTIQQYLKSDAPKDVKLMAAKGLVPMPPLILATVLTFMFGDADEEVRSAARTTLLEMPDPVLEAILAEPVHPKTLDFFSRERISSDHILERILLNSNTNDETFLFLADKVPERLTTIIVNNQVRLLRTPAIAEALKKNPHALKSSIDTMVSFLRMSGILIEGESPELTGEEISQILQMPESQPVVTEDGETLPPEGFPPELMEEFEEEEEMTEEKKKGLYQELQNMTVGQKIKLALLGNKEARTLLVKDSNKIVATSVIKSPKITQGEVLAIANMRTVHDEIIRIIAITPEWTRHYVVQSALANNPKTPFPVALRFMRMLTLGDLDKLSKNKNVSGQLSKLAKSLFDEKRK
jgi:hypothetical protein